MASTLVARFLRPHPGTTRRSLRCRDLIALIRVFTRRLVESLPPDANFYEIAETIRHLCLASTTITRILTVHHLITGNRSRYDDEIDQAVREFWEELENKVSPPALSASSDPPPPSLD